jgi:hypothetical protein
MNVSEVLVASIIRAMNFYLIMQRYNPGDGHLHTRFSENFKSHKYI